MARASIPPHDVADLSLAPEGAGRIEWASQQMAVLAKIRRRFAAERPLAGTRIAACLHVTAETANLLLTLIDGGAQAALCSANPLSTQDDVAAALVLEHGVEVRALRGEDLDSYAGHVRALLDGSPQVTIDDGADLLMTAHAAGGARARGADRRHRGDHHRAGPPAPARGGPRARMSRDRRQRGPHGARAQRPSRDRPVRARRDRPRQPRPACGPHACRRRLWLGRTGDRRARARRRRGRGRLRGRSVARARSAGWPATT